MIRNVNLVSYLPEFIQTYKEPVVALEAENIEFHTIWEAVNRILCNRFIATSDEYGISRFEKMLNIYPTSEDTLENRRLRVQSKWFNKIPYTMKSLKSLLTTLCGENGYILKVDTTYELVIRLGISNENNVDTINSLLEEMLPVNIERKVILLNIHSILEEYTHEQLATYTHEEVKKEILS